MGALVAYVAWGGPQHSPNGAATPKSDGQSTADGGAPTPSPTNKALEPCPEPNLEENAPAYAPTEEACPSGMVLVQGEYCTSVRHTCKHWLDDETLPYARCGEYEPPARCTGQRVPMRFCIDRYEYTAPGEALPRNGGSFVQASALCEQLGKRVCTESEWNFACEGPAMLPYPYGWVRAPVCNQDRSDLYDSNPNRQVLRDNRVPSGSMPECRSPFGVYDMVGNLDEPVLRESQRHAYPFRNALKGGWWMAARNRCRPATTAHDDHYRDVQIGVRCCEDVSSRGGATSEPRSANGNLE
jgi:hypothetical protein